MQRTFADGSPWRDAPCAGKTTSLLLQGEIGTHGAIRGIRASAESASPPPLNLDARMHTVNSVFRILSSLPFVEGMV
jgi:hypothetical protein